MKQCLVATLIGGVIFLVVSASLADPATLATIAQISDTHLGEKHSPQAADNLRKAVEMINARRPDAVVVSGDIGENSGEREKAKAILRGLTAPVYYVPGNHDISNSTNSLEAYRKQFGKDYYSFRVKGVEVLAIDSELLGNYDTFKSKTPQPLSPGMEAESEKMLNWLANQTGAITNGVVIAVQHVPLFRDGSFPNANPYWSVNPVYAQREAELLHKLGVKDLLAGHWHVARIFEKDGLTIHVAPATSWLPLGGRLGFAMHTITTKGDVQTEFVPLAGDAQ